MVKKILYIIILLIVIFNINIIFGRVFGINIFYISSIYLNKLFLPISCQLRGGKIIQEHFFSEIKNTCRIKYPDAQKECFDKKDCQGACILENSWTAADYNFSKVKHDPNNLSVFVIDDQQEDRFRNKKGNCQEYKDSSCFAERNNNKIILHICPVY